MIGKPRLHFLVSIRDRPEVLKPEKPFVVA
jgi:hypothetical protein